MDAENLGLFACIIRRKFRIVRTWQILYRHGPRRVENTLMFRLQDAFIVEFRSAIREFLIRG